MASITLTPELIEHFNISDYSLPKRGGQKTVFIVTIDKIKYALKIINTVDERFEREVRICQKYELNDGIPNIIRIEKFDKDTIIIEEYIEGNDLNDIISQYVGNENKVLKLLLDVATTLKPIWEDQYVHRDLKPQNIRIKKNGKPVVLDFGIARALEEESITATGGGQPYSWPFASPEQYDGKKDLISYRTDFFCLGIIGFFMYTNSLPFGNNRGEINDAFIKSDLSISVSSKTLTDFCNLVFKKNPSERPRKIETIINALTI